MKIILIRHAKVLLDSRQKITASQMNSWVEAYNHALIDRTLPGKEVISLIKDADIVLASSLLRTSDSLSVVGVEPIEKNSLFDEIDLPEAKGTWLKLSSKTWLLLRLMMLADFGKKSKVYIEAKQRAKEAIEYLIHVANTHGSVALVGNGGMHWFVGKELQRVDWKCVEKDGGSKNWGYKVYHKNKREKS